MTEILNTNQSILNNEWKALNLLIGANDACSLCGRSSRPSIQQAGDEFEKNVEKAITLTQQKIPKVFFNIIPLFNVSGVYNLSLDRTYCKYFHDVLPSECPCAFDSTYENRLYLDEVITEYGHRIEKISKSWKSKNISDFTVEYQPYTLGLNLLDLSIDYLSDLDCFHPSLLAHQKVGIAGWNSLITPWSQKPHTFDPKQTLKCADPSSRLFTS